MKFPAVFSTSILVFALFASLSVNATTLNAPEGEVLLVVSGNIEQTNATDSGGQPVAEFDMAMLESLPVTVVETNNPWVEERTKFEGVRISTLLEIIGAKSTKFQAKGVDGYTANIQGVDFDKYPIIIAYKREGDYMSIRALGPLWIIYPFDEYPELNTEYAGVTSVWQLIDMKVE